MYGLPSSSLLSTTNELASNDERRFSFVNIRTQRAHSQFGSICLNYGRATSILCHDSTQRRLGRRSETGSSTPWRWSSTNGNAIMRLPNKRRHLSVVTATSVSVNERAVNETVRYYTMANSGRISMSVARVCQTSIWPSPFMDQVSCLIGPCLVRLCVRLYIYIYIYIYTCVCICISIIWPSKCLYLDKPTIVSIRISSMLYLDEPAVVSLMMSWWKRRELM